MAVFGHENLLRYIEWCMFWGIYPAISEAIIDAQDDIREVYRRHMPIIQAMGQAGWEPVTHARTGNPSVRAERFGYGAQNNLHFALRNFSSMKTRAALTIDAEALKIPETVEIRDAIEGRRLRSRRVTDGIELRVTLEPSQTRVLRVAKPRPRTRRSGGTESK